MAFVSRRALASAITCLASARAAAAAHEMRCAWMEPVGSTRPEGGKRGREGGEPLGGKPPLPERPAALIASRDRMIPARPKEQGAFSWCQHRALNATPFDPASQAQPGHQRCYVRRYARVQRR